MANPIKSLLNRLTKDPAEQKNVMVLGGCSILRHSSLTLTTNEVHQAWSYRLNLQTDQMALLGLPGTILHYIMMVFSCALTDRITNRRRAIIILTFLTSLGALPHLIMALGPASFRAMPTLAVIWIGFGLVGAVSSTFYGPVQAAVDCRAIHNSIRGRQWGVFGMISGGVGLLFGALGTLFLHRLPFPFNFATCFGIGFLLVVIATYIISHITVLPDLKGEEAPKKKGSALNDLAKIFKMRVFWILMPANLLRGLGDGAGTYLAYVAFKRLQLGDHYAGYTMLLSNIALFASYVIILLTFDSLGAGKVLPVTEVLLVTGLLGAVVAPTPLVFLGFYLLWRIMQQLEASAIPLAHYTIVPNEVMGNFSAIRLAMLSLTATISGTTVGFCLAHFSPVVVFACCAILKLAAGAGYCYGLYTVKKPQPAAA